MAYDPTDFNSTADASQLGDGIVIPAYDKVLRWALVPRLVWDQFVTMEPAELTNNGETINLKRHNYLEVTTADLSALDEVAAPDVTSAPQTTNVPVTLEELGKTMGRTTWLGDVAYIPVDPALMQQIARHMSEVLDLKGRGAFLDATNILTSDGGDPEDPPAATNTIVDGDVMTGNIARRAVYKLRKRNAMPVRGEQYVAVVSHDTSLDIQEDGGSTPAWHEPHIAGGDTSNLYNGEIGVFAGALFIETNRAFSDTDGSSSAAVHRSVFFGQEAVAKAVKRRPMVGVSPVTDPMNRHRGIYWYGSQGWSLYRDDVVQVVQHGVSTGVV